MSKGPHKPNFAERVFDDCEEHEYVLVTIMARSPDAEVDRLAGQGLERMRALMALSRTAATVLDRLRREACGPALWPADEDAALTTARQGG